MPVYSDIIPFPPDTLPLPKGASTEASLTLVADAEARRAYDSPVDKPRAGEYTGSPSGGAAGTYA